jgi:hypothetical protein
MKSAIFVAALFTSVSLFAAQLITPVGVYSSHQNSLTWSQSDSDSTWHYLWINDSTGNIYKKWYKTEDVCNEPGDFEFTNYCSVYIENLSPSGRVDWWVREWSATDRSKPWSNKGSYELTSIVILKDFLTSADEWSCTQTIDGNVSQLTYKYFEDDTYQVTDSGVTTTDVYSLYGCTAVSCGIDLPANNFPRTLYPAGPEDFVLKLSPQYLIERTTCERVPLLRNEF